MTIKVLWSTCLWQGIASHVDLENDRIVVFTKKLYDNIMGDFVSVT